MVRKLGFSAGEIGVGASILIVIAIAISMTVPMVTRGANNSSRKRDMDTVVELIVAYQNQNQGSLPTLETLNEVEGLSDLADPDGSAYNFTINGNGQSTGTASSLKSAENLDHKVYIFTGAACAGNYPVSHSSQQVFAVLYKLEGAGNLYCTDNS